MDVYDKTLDANAPLDDAELERLDLTVEHDRGQGLPSLAPHEVVFLGRLIPPEMTVGRRLLATHRAMSARLGQRPSLLARVRGWWRSLWEKRKPNTMDGRRLITSCLHLKQQLTQGGLQ